MAKKVVKPTNNGKTYTFNLRHNAKWSNGKRSRPLTLFIPCNARSIRIPSHRKSDTLLKSRMQQQSRLVRRR
ncbi:hypothetical protein MAA39_12425 [Lactiplantibacillus plantarum]|nr:hypothetical protein [Lactiplantibacillus plantarum]